MTDVVDAPNRPWMSLPRWARFGIILLAAIVVVLVAIVAVRLATRVPAIPLGVTAVDDLRPGACLAEDARDAAEYTVVGCGEAHAQQVFAVADLDLDDDVYALVDDALVVFGDQVCDRYLEYRLFLLDDLETSDFEAYAIAVPTSAAYADGDTEALCAIADDDGAALTSDLYRAMP